MQVNFTSGSRRAARNVSACHPRSVVGTQILRKKKKDGNTPLQDEPQRQTMNPATARWVCISPPYVTNRTLPPRHRTRHQQTTQMRFEKHTRTPLQIRWIDQEACCGNQFQLTRSTLPGEFPHDGGRDAINFDSEGGVHRHGDTNPLT